MKKAILILLALTVTGSGMALASGSSSSSGAANFEQEPLQVTQTMRCVVTEIRADGTVMVRDSQNKEPHALPFSKKTRFVAQSKKDFDGRKKLAANDLVVGQNLRVTLVPDTMEILRVRVLKKKS